jgi:hypothetical protein
MATDPVTILIIQRPPGQRGLHIRAWPRHVLHCNSSLLHIVLIFLTSFGIIYARFRY